jgi:uncharacterized protein (AIM24 family)
MKKWVLIFCVMAVLLSTIQVAKAECVTVDGYFIAASEELLDMAVKYFIRKDINSLMSLVDEGLVLMVHGGAKVHIEGSSGLGKLKIRFPGATMPVWTLREGIKCK